MWRKAIIIAKRELKSYFDSPVAYIVLVSYLLVSGWMFFSTFFLMGRADMRMYFAPSPFSPSMLLVILAPAVTMRLIAEERKTGTFELLTTMPVRDSDVIAGKFLAALALVVSALFLTLSYPLCIAMLGSIDWGPVICGYLGMFLFAAALLAIGTLCSTLAKNQIVAFILGFVICAALYFVYWLQFLLPQTFAPLAEFISVSFHLDNMARGIIDTRDVLYYLTLTFGSLFLAERQLSQIHG
jgi:ABC-2 type transport system permease protein